jgi:coenzyme F420-0:L-glutamate ligase / coenzyme F420-1:gamma-L-glutamate ligase
LTREVAPAELHLFAVPGIPEVTEGADLAQLIADAATRAGFTIEAGDVFVIAQKIVSKAEGALVRLHDVVPSPLATEWAAAWRRDAAIVEVVLRESRRIVRMDRGIIIAETKHGFICANAGVDASNVPEGFVTLLPEDPDASAAGLQAALSARFNRAVATIVADTFGRPWREGVVNVALGVAGLVPLLDCRGTLDRFGRTLETTVISVADEIASAAELVMGKCADTPVAIVRGASRWLGAGRGAQLLRSASTDMFR